MTRSSPPQTACPNCGSATTPLGRWMPPLALPPVSLVWLFCHRCPALVGQLYLLASARWPIACTAVRLGELAYDLARKGIDPRPEVAELLRLAKASTRHERQVMEAVSRLAQEMGP